MSFESALKLALDEVLKKSVEAWATNKYGKRFPIFSTVEHIDYSQIYEYRNYTKKEDVDIEISIDNVEWYGIKKDGIVVSFYGLKIYGDKARFKGSYTLKDYRKQGCLQSLIEHAKKTAKERGCKTMNLFCTELSKNIHLRNGAVQEGKKENFLVYYL